MNPPRRRRQLLILLTFIATVFFTAVMLRRLTRGSTAEENRAAQGRAFAAAATTGVEIDTARAQARAAAEQYNPAAAAEARPSSSAFALSASARKDRLRRENARREFLSNPALWLPPKSAQVAAAAKDLERSYALWANSLLDKDQVSSGEGYFKADVFASRRRLDTLLEDHSQLRPSVKKEVDGWDANPWNPADLSVMEPARFQALINEGKPAPSSPEQRAAADFRSGVYDDMKFLLKALLEEESLYEMLASEMVRAPAPPPKDEGPQPGPQPAPVDETMESYADLDRLQSLSAAGGAKLRRTLQTAAANAAQNRAEWEAKHWEGFELKFFPQKADAPNPSPAPPPAPAPGE